MANSTTEYTVRVQAEDFDVLTETEILTKGRKDVGAIVTFTGLCRDEGGTLEALELEHYPGMAEAQISKFAQQAVERWPITGLTIIHRFGKILRVRTSCWSLQPAHTAVQHLKPPTS